MDAILYLCVDIKMSKSDVEMEDPRELPNDSENNVQEPKSPLDDKIKIEEEISPPAAAVIDVNVRENGGSDVNKCETEVKDKTETKIEVNDQINPESEADKPMERSVSGEINTKSDNNEDKINTETNAEEQINTETNAEEQINTETNAEEQINTETKAEEQTAPTSAVEKQIDVISKVVEHKDTDRGLEEEKPSENGVEGESYQENVEKIFNEDVEQMKPKEIGNVEMNYGEPVSGGEMTMGKADSGDKPLENTQLPTETANEDPQRQDAQSDDVPQGKDEEMADAVDFDEEKTIKDKDQSGGTVLASGETGGDDRVAEIAAKQDVEESSLAIQQVAKPELLSSCSSAKAVDNNGEMAISVFTPPTLHLV